VEVDLQAAQAALRQSRHPTQEYLMQFLEGRFWPPWAHDANLKRDHDA
jgi:hypothetical protein